MILRRLELRHFGRLGVRTFEFRHGMNLVFGPSESGKSTLAEAVPVALFGTREPERFRSWGSQAGCEAALLFDASGQTVRIERNLLTDQVAFTEADAEGRSLHHFAAGVPCGHGAEAEPGYGEHLARLFGSAREEFFRLCLIVEQGAAERSGAAGLPVWSAAVTACLSDTVVTPRSDDAAMELEAVRRRLSELEKSWFATREALAQEPEPLQRMEARETVTAAESADPSEVRPSPGQGRRPAVAPEEQTVAEPLAVQMGQRRAALEKELAKTGLPRQMPSGLPAILVQADEIRQEMIAIQQDAAALRQQLLTRQGPSWRPAAAGTACFALGAAGLAWLRPEWLSPGLLAGGLVSALAWGHFLWRSGLERGERGRLKGQLQVLEDRRDEAQGRLTGLDEQFSRLGLSPSVVEIVRMQKNLERHQRLLQELAEVEGALGVLGPDAAQQGAGTAVKAAPAGPGPLVSEELPDSPAGRDAAQGRSALLGAGLKAGAAARAELCRRPADRDALREELRKIEEEGEALRRREGELLRRIDSAQPAPPPPVAGRIVAALPDQFVDQLGQMLALITSGRYGAVRFNGDTLPLLRGEDGGWHPLGQFSRGTAASFCLAFRLVLSRHLSGGRRLPLLLDDPLAGLDQERQAETLKLLERLAAEQQVILFTGDEALRKRGVRERWHTVSLGAGSAIKTAKVEERSEENGQLHLL